MSEEIFVQENDLDTLNSPPMSRWHMYFSTTTCLGNEGSSTKQGEWHVSAVSLLSVQIGYVKLIQSFPFHYRYSENLMIS